MPVVFTLFALTVGATISDTAVCLKAYTGRTHVFYFMPVGVFQHEIGKRLYFVRYKCYMSANMSRHVFLLLH